MYLIVTSCSYHKHMYTQEFDISLTSNMGNLVARTAQSDSCMQECTHNTRPHLTMGAALISNAARGSHRGINALTHVNETEVPMHCNHQHCVQQCSRCKAANSPGPTLPQVANTEPPLLLGECSVPEVATVCGSLLVGPPCCRGCCSISAVAAAAATTIAAAPRALLPYQVTSWL